jgi:hypothetical protein
VISFAVIPAPAEGVEPGSSQTCGFIPKIPDECCALSGMTV